MEELDYILALQLQETFHSEVAESSTNKENQLSSNIPKEYGSSTNSNGNGYPKSGSQSEQTTSLNDPSWEVIDPTPDIFALFAAFNDRFFWGKLVAVEVKWSSQMTSCAGLCYYQGRGGLCSVRLSTPLLKLRPRSDLVNTLLHEMIHAYLFVTANNRDRDGHGPEFHKHMNRINKEAGTKITVYHTFHDEVRLYQQHWWRCEGPCRTKKPYFGFVKRAKNRAPGPNDLWWGNHQAECGGTYIKVKEPENYVNKNKKGKVSSTASDSKPGKPGPKDIRSFFPQPSTSKSSDPKPATSTNSIVSSNVVGFNDLNKPTSSSKNNPPTKSNSNSNILGFNNLNSPGVKSKSNSGKSNSIPGRSTSVSGSNNSGKSNIIPGRSTSASGSSSGKGRGFVGGGLKNKGSSTLVIPPKTQTRTEVKTPEDKKPDVKKSDNPLNIDRFQAFKTNGQVLGGQVNDRSRSRLLLSNQNQPEKQSTQSKEQQNSFVDGRRIVDCSSPPRTKKPFSFLPDSKKRSVSANINDFTKEVKSSKPVTQTKRSPFSDENRSQDIPSTSSACSDPVFGFKTSSKRRSTSTSNFSSSSEAEERHSTNKRSLYDLTDKIDVDNLVEKELVSCPVCTAKIKRFDLNSHLEGCVGLKDIFSNSVICESDDEDIFVEKKINNTPKKRTTGKTGIAKNNVNDLNGHSSSFLSNSVISISDDEDTSSSKKPNSMTVVGSENLNGNASSDPDVLCPCCNKLIPNSRINQHLDICLSEMALEDLV